MPPTPFYLVAGTGTALVIIALCLELTFRYPQARIFTPFVATGQLALTLYVAHVVVGMGILESLGRLENQTLPFAILSAFLFSVLAVVFSYFWRNRFRRGPLEWAMRQITG